MIRKAFTMRVHPGNEVEYEKRHSPIWPELEAKLKEHGVNNYSIFLADDLTLFGYVEIEDEERWAALAGTEIVKKWWAHMAPIMPSNPDNSPVQEELRQVFHMD